MKKSTRNNIFIGIGIIGALILIAYFGGVFAILPSEGIISYYNFEGNFNDSLGGNNGYGTALFVEGYTGQGAEFLIDGNAWCNGGDITKDGIIDANDYDILDKAYLFQDGCKQSNNWCNGGDITKDGKIDANDYDRVDKANLFQVQWGGCKGGDSVNIGNFQSGDISFSISALVNLYEQTSGIIMKEGEWNLFYENKEFNFCAGGVCSKSGITEGWNHLVAVYNSETKTTKLYINGTAQVESDTGYGIIPTNKDIIIGNGTRGIIDEVIIFNTALTDAKIQELFYPVEPIPEPESNIIFETILIIIGIIGIGIAVWYIFKKHK